MRFKLELMDWKAVESQAREQIRIAETNKAMSEIILASASVEIHKLGGKTAEEEELDVKKELKKST